MDIMGPANGTNGFKAKGTQMKDKMVHIFPAVLFVFPGWTSVNPDCIHVMKVKEDAVGTGADLIDSGAIFILIPCWNFSQKLRECQQLAVLLAQFMKHLGYIYIQTFCDDNNN